MLIVGPATIVSHTKSLFSLLRSSVLLPTTHHTSQSCTSPTTNWEMNQSYVPEPGSQKRPLSKNASSSSTAWPPTCTLQLRTHLLTPPPPRSPHPAPHLWSHQLQELPQSALAKLLAPTARSSHAVWVQPCLLHLALLRPSSRTHLALLLAPRSPVLVRDMCLTPPSSSTRLRPALSASRLPAIVP